MNSNDTFILHGKIEVDSLVHIIEANSLDWDEWVDRQLAFKVEHIHTKTIPIIFDKSLNFNHLKIIPTNHYALFKDELSKIETIIKKNVNEDGKIIRALLVKLTAGESIRAHTDTSGYSLVVCRRIHIPIDTNNECFFTVGDDKRNLKLGEMWEINNDKKIHSVDNFGKTDRIHLIVDWVAESIFKQYDSKLL
jgi:hypothetical protein